VFELVERPTFGEIEYVERMSKKPSDEWSSLLQARAVYFMSVRRADPTLLTWDQMSETSPMDFAEIPEPEEVDDAQDPLFEVGAEVEG
jgi:hypothetical protein